MTNQEVSEEIKYLEKVEENLINEVRFFSDEYLNHQGPLSGLQKAVNQNYLDMNYIEEKINTIKKTMDAIEHEVNTVIEVRIKIKKLKKEIETEKNEVVQ
jgi:hypothetical protein